MKLFKRRIGPAFALVAGLLLCGVASATPVTMNFDGLTPGTSVDTYYDGGHSTKSVWSWSDWQLHNVPVDSNGPNYGVVWENAWVQRGGASAPNSMVPIIASVMNVAAGFETGLSFDYYGLAGIGIYSSDGTQLVYRSLPVVGDWNFVDISFLGTATSAVFYGGPIVSGFDNVTFQPNPVPEPAAVGVFGLGLLLIAGFVGLRRRQDRMAAGSL